MMLASVVAILGACSGLSAGADTGTPEMAGMVLAMFCTVFIPLCAGGLALDLSKNKQLKTTMLARRDSLRQIAQKYNQVTELLKSSYKYEKSQLGSFDSVGKEALRVKFEEQYNRNKAAFEKERRAYLASSNIQTPTSVRFKTFWKSSLASSVRVRGPMRWPGSANLASNVSAELSKISLFSFSMRALSPGIRCRARGFAMIRRSRSF